MYSFGKEYIKNNTQHTNTHVKMHAHADTGTQFSESTDGVEQELRTN